jgi:GT2 family glycosyltransferase
MIQFSVIIPTYQRPNDLARCLEQLKPGAQSLPFEHYEVIVTDDEGKGGNTQTLVAEKYPWAKWVAGPGRGPAANRNCGADYAQGNWLVFTDDDCIPSPKWLRAYAKEAKNSVAVMEGATVPEGPRESLAWQAPINTEGGKLWSCNLAIKVSCFSALGGFDTDYPFALEDMDFKTRVLKKEMPWTFVQRAVVVHPWRYCTARQLFARQMRELNGWRVFAQKHPKSISNFNIGYLASIINQAVSDIDDIDLKPMGIKEYAGFIIGHSLKKLYIVLTSLKISFTSSNE